MHQPSFSYKHRRLVSHVVLAFVCNRWRCLVWFNMSNLCLSTLDEVWTVGFASKWTITLLPTYHCSGATLEMIPKWDVCLHFHRWTVLCFVFNSHCLPLIFSQYFGYYFHVWRRFATSKHNSPNVQSHIKVTVDLFGTLHFKVIFEVHSLTCSVSLNVFYQCATGR